MIYLNFGGFMAQCILDRSKTLEDFLGNPEMWLAQEYKGTRYRYTPDEMKGLWGCILEEQKRIDKIQSFETTKLFEDFF